MSRIGRIPVLIPSDVTITLSGNTVLVKGKKGELSYTHRPEIKIEIKDKELITSPLGEEKEIRSFHGLTRSLIQNMIEGVSKGFEKKLEIIGVGYKAEASGKKLTLHLGFSHPVEMEVPEGLSVEIEKKTKYLIVSGIDKQKVGQFSAEIRSLRKPEPYKGKGVRYLNEYVARKAGKAASK